MIERFAGRAPWEGPYGYCRAVRAGEWALVAGTTATAPGGGALHPGDAYGQTLAAFGIALEVLVAIGVPAEQVVRTRMYITDRAHEAAVGRAHGELFAAIRPAATMVVVAGLIDPALLVEVEVDAYVGHGTPSADSGRDRLPE